MFNRFLGAFKSQLERKWSRQHSVVNKESYTKSADSPGLAGHARQWSRALRTPVVRLEEPEDKETNPLSPLPPMEDSTNSLEKTVVSWRGFWMPSVPWSITRDGISAVLEFVRALIGYIL